MDTRIIVVYLNKQNENIMKNSANTQSDLQFIRGEVLNKMIADKVKHPSLYCGGGSCRKWSLELMRKFINRCK